MTTYPIENLENTTQANKAVELISVSKKYPLAKTGSKDIAGNFEEFWALSDISFDIYQGQVLGIIGRNGAGKTTLLNIIADVLSSTQGRISVKGKVLGLFNLGVGFQDELTGRENIFLNGAIIGATKKELENKLSAIIDFSELGSFIDMPLGTYSQGMRLRLAFSIIANLDFDILVIDEVLAVGDALFQSKCFERLMDFRRSGKTLIITTQDMSLIERLCDRAILLDHGYLLSQGEPLESINRYRALLNTEKFFVGPAQKNLNLVENTKKWADDVSIWGKKYGAKEAIIDSVDFINKFGLKCHRIKSSEPLKIKVHFTVRDTIKKAHFGVAIFRNDGVYCYGPNTEFDGYNIPALKPAKGYFLLNYDRLLLGPGEYRVSVAIWDKNETIAFDYHEGYYTLLVNGYNNPDHELLNMPFELHPNNYLMNIFRSHRYNQKPDVRLLSDKWMQHSSDEKLYIKSVKMLNNLGEEKEVFVTGESIKFVIQLSEFMPDKDYHFWFGLYRDDGVYCQGITSPVGKHKQFNILFPKLSLLPGSYRVSFGIWSAKERNFLSYYHGIYHFRTVFNRLDHGTVYLRHSWSINKT